MAALGHACDRQERIGEPDEGLAIQVTEQAEQVDDEYKGLHKERGNAEPSVGDNV